MSRFGLWKFLNRDTRTVQVAADLVAYALTLISGPLCDCWARGIQDKLALKVLGNPLYHIPLTHTNNNPVLWDWFVREFLLQFTDSAEEENAFAALQKLELKENDMDTYINHFIELAEKAQWGLDAPGTIRLFHDGLPVNMHCTICRYQHLPRDMQEWFTAMREECRRYNDMAVSIGPRGGAGNISTCQNHLRGIEPPNNKKERTRTQWKLMPLKQVDFLMRKGPNSSKKGGASAAKRWDISPGTAPTKRTPKARQSTSHEAAAANSPNQRPVPPSSMKTRKKNDGKINWVKMMRLHHPTLTRASRSSSAL